MVAQQQLGKAMNAPDPELALVLMDQSIAQAQAASEVLHGRG